MEHDWKKKKVPLELALPRTPSQANIGKASTCHIERNKGKKIRLIENNAKCRYIKKLTCNGTLRQVFYLSEAPLLSYDPILPPPFTHCILVYKYNYSHREGGGALTIMQRED